ncbi:MAG: LysM peptidoglycan-binding domain-containing protein [Bacteroidia bacterium]|nr:LysM peptidoglycan-binding domain-containing protein [Bacteroidia bacterium]
MSNSSTQPVKLTIQGTTARPGSPSGSSGNPDQTFTCQINPERISFRRSISYAQSTPTATAGNAPQMQGPDNEQLSFDLIFDGTGVIEDEPVDIEAEIRKLEQTVYQIEGEIHRPLYVMVTWGNFGFKCQLESMNTEYTLFAADGKPLRAKVALAFVASLPSQARQQQAAQASPDLTHIRTVRLGDSLPLMCREIYNDTRYYLQIAEINGLTNFRTLEPGTELLFPPLAK